LGEISVSRGEISAGYDIVIFLIYTKYKNNYCYFGNKSFDALSTPWFVTKVIKQWFSTFHGLWPPSKDSQHLWLLLINKVLQYHGRAI